MHAALLAASGVPGPSVGPLAAYLDHLAAWSVRTNLTAASTPAERVALLVEAVRPAAALIDAGPLVDVGAGNGSPGLVLALLRPDVRVVLLEPRQKRWAFLREAARVCGRPDVDVRRERHDGYTGPLAGVVTVRAVGLSPRALAPLVRPGGRLLVFGEPPEPAPDDLFLTEPALATSRGPVVVLRRRDVPRET
jgi:16S rRNA (guanine527-N7)-methyltransferase